MIDGDKHFIVNQFYIKVEQKHAKVFFNRAKNQFYTGTKC